MVIVRFQQRLLSVFVPRKSGGARRIRSGEECLTIHPDFRDNMLSEGVLKIDVCRYLEENWPLDDGDLEKIHKLYRLVAYQRCSRWIFQILGKKRRRPFPACGYSRLRERFASPDGLYTHFKYAKTSKR